MELNAFNATAFKIKGQVFRLPFLQCVFLTASKAPYQGGLVLMGLFLAKLQNLAVAL